MDFLNEPVFTQTDKSKVDAAFYQVIFDEIIRLRKCKNSRERDKIRNFIMEAYQLLSEKIPENVIEYTSQESNLKQQ